MALLVIGCAALAVAQSRGGGHSGVGYGARTAVGALGGRPFPARSNLPTPVGLTPPAAGYFGIAPGALRSYGPRRDYRRYPASYFFAPYYYPALDYANSAYPEPAPEQSGYADDGTVQAVNALGNQVQRLGAEVAQLRQAQPQQTSAPDPAPAPVAPVILILRNGQQLQVVNYAVMGQTFWDFSSNQTRKIPIANIDLSASARATEAGGGQFPDIDSGS
jgi:hypothetical protein